jgi:hypothetical protein
MAKSINEWKERTAVKIAESELTEAIGQLLDDINDYFILLEEYRGLVIGSDFVELEEATELDENGIQKLLREFNLCIIRIEKDVTSLQKVLDKTRVYSKAEVTKSNRNLVDLFTTCRTITMKYNLIEEINNRLEVINTSLSENVKILSDLIHTYNEGKEFKLYTVREALADADSNSPTFD